MGRISTDVGLVSGIKTREIIDQLMALEERPKVLLQGRIDVVNQKKLAYTDLSTRLTSLRLTSTQLKKPSTFQASATSSSNEDVMTATASANAALGTYQFQVARLVSTQQSISKGFTDFNSAKLSTVATKLTIEQGGGELYSQAPLSQLNGGDGVRRGVFRITDRSGATAVIDTSAAVTLDDVVKKINTSLDISVRASLGDNGIVLEDITGKTASNLIVQDLVNSYAAADLGLVGSVAGNTLTGTAISTVGRNTLLDSLNDGRGIRTGSSTDFTINLQDGSSHNVAIGTKKTLGEVIDTINALAPGDLVAEINAAGDGLKLTDNTSGGDPFEVVAGTSQAATDLGILGASPDDEIDGAALIAGLNTVMISSLNGGDGFTLGTIRITDRSGDATNIDLSSARTVQDVLDAISNAGAIDVTAKLNNSGNGIQIIDDTTATGDIVIADISGTTAVDFGFNGTFTTDTPAVQGKNLQRQWVTENTMLSTYNGGKGVVAGKFKITNSAGISATIDLTQGDEIRLKNVISEINSKNIGITARINDTGDGLLLEDTAAGALKLTVEDLDGTTATDLRIAGEATTTTIDGTFEKTIDITTADTLETVQKKINDLNFGLTASIINDGSGLAPYRLSLTAKNSGMNGRVVFDAGATSLDPHKLVEAQDAAVFLGGAGSEQPLLITAGKNQIAGVIRGVTLDLHGVSNQPVTIGVTRNIDNVAKQLTDFATSFNELIVKVKELTAFDPATQERGLLLGEGVIQRVEAELFASFTSVVAGAGRYKILSEIGLRIGEGSELQFDEEKFRTAYATDPESVQNLFALAEKGIGTVMETKITKLIDPVNGIITRENKTLDSRTLQFQDRIEAIDKLLEAKRFRLEKQFAQMETVLANLQNQQTAIGQIQTIQLNNKK